MAEEALEDRIIHLCDPETLSGYAELVYSPWNDCWNLWLEMEHIEVRFCPLCGDKLENRKSK